MKKFLYVLAASVAVVLVFGCREKDEPNDEPQEKPVEYTISGRVEKGPFLKDSKVSLQPLDASFQAVGEPVEVSVSDNLGRYDLGKVSLDCPYAELTATGKFFNEVSESVVETPVTLRALVNLKDKSKVNVNILTHLEYARVKTLLAAGVKYEYAAAMARSELVEAFGLGGFTIGDFSEYGIAEGTDQSAALILASISAILHCEDEEIAAYIDNLSKEFEADGSFSEEYKTTISKNKEIMSWNVDKIAPYIKEIYSGLGETIEVKNLRNYIDWDENGVVGDESVPEGYSVNLDKTELKVPAAGGKYTVNVDSPVALYLEKHGPETEDQEIKPIQPETVNIYDVDMDGVVRMTVSLEGETLTVDVAPNKGKVVADSVIVLYDFFGTEVASLAVKQEVEDIDGIPGLSEDGKALINTLFSDMNKALDWWNYLGPSQDPRTLFLESFWTSWYNTINQFNSVKSIDAKDLNVYGPYFDFYLALSYFHLESVFGDVPYVADGSTYEGVGLPRTPQSEVVSNIVTMLEASLEAVEEKPVSTNSVSDCFFVSKDCVRLLLAEVNMESGDFRKAAALLNAVSLKNPVDEILVVKNYYDPFSKPQLVFGWGDYLCDLAECELALGNKSRAVEIINSFYYWIGGGYEQVREYWDLREELEVMRELIPPTRLFLFRRRNGFLEQFYNLKEYQKMWPIPESVMVRNPGWKQNPGY
ncbi:hypothetical protein SAMN06298215_1139 [Bacteroidales bacterium WCE2008]|nr:hypothetical protein SAMN06298215_1139 [Bacteroidales bacterium WCE2008]